jgi:HK97 family phage major capsid protein
MLNTHPHRAAWNARVAAFAAMSAAYGIRAEASPQSLQAELATMRASQERLVARSNAVLAAADSEGRELTQEERRAIVRRTEEVERLELQAEAIEARLDEPQPRLTSHDPMTSNRAGGARLTARAGAAGGIGRAAVMAAFPGGNDGGFADLGGFAAAVARRDPRLHAQAGPTGMQTQIGADGGFAIPPRQLMDLMSGALESETMRPRCMFVPMESGVVTLPRFKDQDRSTGHAGLQGKAVREGATGTAQKPVMEKLTLTARKLQVLVPMTNELIEDAGPLFTRLLGSHMGAALAAKIDDLLFLGTGAGDALGLINAPCTVTVSKEVGQASATILPRNLAKMVARLAPGSFVRSVWLANSTVVAQLFVLVEKIQNAGATDFVGGIDPGWFTVAPNGDMTLMGRPLVITDRLQPLGTLGDIVLADLSKYMVGQVGDARLAIDTSHGFTEDETWFRLSIRIDGQPVLGSAITPRRGSDSLSPFVLLEAR